MRTPRDIVASSNRYYAVSFRNCYQRLNLFVYCECDPTLNLHGQAHRQSGMSWLGYQHLPCTRSQVLDSVGQNTIWKIVFSFWKYKILFYFVFSKYILKVFYFSIFKILLKSILANRKILCKILFKILFSFVSFPIPSSPITNYLTIGQFRSSIMSITLVWTFFI